MEVVDYLKLARRRLWIIVMIPLLAAAAVVGHWQLSTRTYEAGAYVFAPDALTGAGTQFSGPAGISEWVNEFAATAVSPRVVRQVAQASGVPAQDIVEGLQVTQQKQSGQLLVNFSSTSPRAAVKVVKHVSLATSRALFAPSVALARRALTRAQASLQAANQQMLDATVTWRHTRPDQLYTARLRDLVDSQQARTAIKSSDTAARTAADARIARLRAQVADLQQQVIEFQNLRAQRMAATTVLERADGDLLTARAQYTGALGAVTLLPVRPAQASSALLKSILSAVVAGLFIGLCLIAAMELFRPSRDTSRRVFPLGTDTAHGVETLQPPVDLESAHGSG